MSDSEIILESPDISIDYQETPHHTSDSQDVVDSSYVDMLSASIAESVILGSKKRAMVIRSTSSDEEFNLSNISEISGSTVESLHMSVDKSALEQSNRNMSVDKSELQQSNIDISHMSIRDNSIRDMSIAVSSRSSSPDEILDISSSDEEDDPIAVNTTQNKPQIKLRPSLLSPFVQRGEGTNISKVYAPINIQHSTPIKHIEKKTEDEKGSSGQHQQGQEISQKLNDNNIRSKIQESLPDAAALPIETILIEAEDLKANTKIEVSSAQYQQQREYIQKLNFDIIRAKNMLHSINIEKLPDKGAMLKERYAHLQKDLQEAQVLWGNMVVAAGLKPMKTVAWENLETGLAHVQPNTFGKKALQTLNFQKSLTLDALKELHGSLNTCPDVNTFAPNPRGLKVDLMPHQKHALAWLIWREQQKPSGGILADDMGLGKTLTMISLILHCKHQSLDENTESDDTKASARYSGGTLVVCPASLIFQWEAEVKKHVRGGLLSVTLHHGNDRETKSKRLAKSDIVITTYGLVMRDHTNSGPLFNIRWCRIILDEAHQVRNHKSQTSLAVCELYGKFRWGLTGTPVHNKELDLYALLKFLRCSPFDDLVVWKRWVANKSAGGQDRLNTVLSSLILRRTKQQLAEQKLLNCLPEMKWELIQVTLDPEEMKIYQKVLIFSRTLFAQYLHYRAEKDTESLPESVRIDNPNSEYYKMHQKLTKLNRVKPIKQHEILVLLLRLRQICCHPSLITNMLLGDENAGDFEDEECEEMNILDQLNKLNIEEEEPLESVAEGLSEENRVGLAEASRNILSSSHPVFAENRKSSKIKKVLSILDTILSKEEKVIIISQWTKLLNLMGMQLKKKSIQYYQLDGSVPVPKRMSIINNFNDQSHSTKVLLLSLTAGGVGLNLVGANNLLLIDLHWNPQLEIQAQDRIYRVGQTKPVQIYKIITNDTIEQRIKQLQDKKLQLAEELLTGTKIKDHKLTLDDLKMLFSM